MSLNIALFEDVTDRAGIRYTGMTHGAYWGDFDGDGRPDLYVNNHLNAPALFRNLGRGKFEDVTAKWFPAPTTTHDKHGAAWADFDNDGRLDLVQLTGTERGVGSEMKQLFVNRGDHFEESGATLGMANPLGRTRMPLWFDFDRDGKLDLFEGAEARFDDQTPPFVFMQRDGRFVAADGVAAFASRTVPFCIVTEITGSGVPDLVCRISGKNKTAQIFSTGSVPLREHELLPATAFEDVAAGDFDNDGRIDLFLARKNPAPPVTLAQTAGGELIADMQIDGGNVNKPTGFRFRSKLTPTFRVAPANPTNVLAPTQIRVGAAAHPTALRFTPTPADAKAGGPTVEPGAADGLFVTHSPPDQWQVQLTASRESINGKSRYQQVAVQVTAADSISHVEVLREPGSPEDTPFRLFMNRDGKLIEESEKRGVNARIVSAVNVVAGDFNNDGYLDLFVVASGDIGKEENLLLLNRGDGTFAVVKNAGGAAGEKIGVGDSVTTADFDNDGCLDLFIATGGSMGRSLGIPSERGGYRLYHNLCNTGNHWLEIDLEGTKSNRDGIGARVELLAGNLKQVRIQDGGIHHRGQNHARLHFGLGKSQQVVKLTIRWPSGTVQDLANFHADRVIRIKEP